VRVFLLQNAIASEVANTLRTLFLGQQGQGGLGFALFGGGRGQIPPNSPLDLLRQVTIVPNDQTNQLLISGPAQTFPVIEALLAQEEGLDRRLPQVFIEVLIADITLDDQLRFGVEWTAMSGSSLFGTDFGLSGPAADSTGFRYSVLSRNVQATLTALRQTDRIQVISTPHVMVTDNSPALISIGESIPYAGQTTITAGLAQTAVEFQDVSITLTVTPHISPGDNILMDIDQVVNSLIGFINVAPGQVAPRTTSRRAGTTVIVQDNQTVVLGGIISQDEQRTIRKVPILGDIPILGQLFRRTDRQRARTELVVFITPRIVRDTYDAEEVREYERQRLQVDPLNRLDAPFTRPLEITPERLRELRRQETLRQEEELEAERQRRELRRREPEPVLVLPEN
jgi:general secretion pathway protein D